MNGQSMRRNGKRRTRYPRATGSFGVVLFAILNLALQPCVMAMNPDADHGCPHCPPGMRHAVHDHGQKLAEFETCEISAVYHFDGRGDQPPAKQPSPDLASLPADVAVLPAYVASADRRPARLHLPRYTGDPPLNVLHCVYLK